VWVPKYRYRILTGPIREWVHEGIQSLCSYAGCEVTQLNVQQDHAHLIVMVPPKVAISDFMGRLKGQEGKLKPCPLGSFLQKKVILHFVMEVCILLHNGGI